MWCRPHHRHLKLIDSYNRTMHHLKTALSERVSRGEMRPEEAEEVAGMIREQEYRKLTVALEKL